MIVLVNLLDREGITFKEINDGKSEEYYPIDYPIIFNSHSRDCGRLTSEDYLNAIGKLTKEKLIYLVTISGQCSIGDTTYEKLSVAERDIVKYIKRAEKTIYQLIKDKKEVVFLPIYVEGLDNDNVDDRCALLDIKISGVEDGYPTLCFTLVLQKTTKNLKRGKV